MFYILYVVGNCEKGEIRRLNGSCGEKREFKVYQAEEWVIPIWAMGVLSNTGKNKVLI